MLFSLYNLPFPQCEITGRRSHTVSNKLTQPGLIEDKGIRILAMFICFCILSMLCNTSFLASPKCSVQCLIFVSRIVLFFLPHGIFSGWCHWVGALPQQDRPWSLYHTSFFPTAFCTTGMPSARVTSQSFNLWILRTCNWFGLIFCCPVEIFNVKSWSHIFLLHWVLEIV